MDKNDPLGLFSSQGASDDPLGLFEAPSSSGKMTALENPVTGAGEALLNLGTTLLMAPGAGVRGLVRGRGTTVDEWLKSAVDEGQQWLEESTYKPHGETGQGASERLTGALDWIRNKTGEGAEALTNAVPYGSEEGDLKLRALFRTGGEVGADLAPLPAVGKGKLPKKGGAPTPEPTPPARWEPRTQTELFKENPADLVAPELRDQGFQMQGGKMGGLLPPDVIARLEAELNPVAERAPEGQTRLFANEEVPAMSDRNAGADVPIRTMADLETSQPPTGQASFLDLVNERRPTDQVPDAQGVLPLDPARVGIDPTLADSTGRAARSQPDIYGGEPRAGVGSNFYNNPLALREAGLADTRLQGEGPKPLEFEGGQTPPQRPLTIEQWSLKGDPNKAPTTVTAPKQMRIGGKFAKQRGSLNVGEIAEGMKILRDKFRDGSDAMVEFMKKTPFMRSEDRQMVLDLVHTPQNGDFSLRVTDSGGKVRSVADISWDGKSKQVEIKDVRSVVSGRGDVGPIYRALEKQGFEIKKSDYTTEQGKAMQDKQSRKELYQQKVSLEAKLNRAMDTRDTMMAQMYREQLKKIETQLANGTTPLGGVGKRGFGQGGAFTPFAKKEGLAKSIAENSKQFENDRRTLPQLFKDMGQITKDKLQDISGKITDLGIDKTVAILAEGKGLAGEIVKNIVDRRREIDRMRRLNAERALIGEKFKEGIGRVFRPYQARVLGDTGILSKWRQTKHLRDGHKELREFLDVAIPNIGKNLDRSAFKSDRQYAIYQDIQNGLKQVWSDVNKARIAAGLEPIASIDGYLPARWEGDYRVAVKDGLGNTIVKFGFDNKLQMAFELPKLKKAHPEWVFEAVKTADDPKTKIMPLSAFEDALAVNLKNKQAYSALQASLAKLRTKRGLGGSFLQKTGVGGFLGTETGMKGVANMERALEQYTKQAYNYISNLEKSKLQAEVAQIPQEVRIALPNTINYLNDYLNNAKGAIDGTGTLGEYLRATSDAVGFGRSGPEALIANTSSLASTYWLLTPRFFLSQLPQHLNALAKVVDVTGSGKAAMEVWLGGMKETFYPSDGARAAANWAKQNGYFESSIIEMMNMSMKDMQVRPLRMIDDAGKWAMGKFEENMVRLPTYLMFEKMLRDAIPDATQRYQRAAEMMDYYMVHYDRESSPMVYQKTGLLGQAARPLKQFSHNAWGQFFEYLNKAPQDVKPLATLLGTQVLVGGLKGTVLVAEATAIITLINAMTDAQIPTPEEILLKSNLPDMLVYGGYSTALGYDLSSSVSAPSIPNMFSLPAVDFGSGMVKDAGKYLLHKLQGTNTTADEYNAALALAPKMMHGWIENLYTGPGGVVPQPHNRNMEGSYRRTEEEKTIASAISMKSINEVKTQALARIAKRELAVDMQKRIGAVQAITDRIQNGGELSDDLIERFIAEGGDIGNLPDAIMKNLKDQSMTAGERAMDAQSVTPQQAHKLEVMKELLDQETKNAPIKGIAYDENDNPLPQGMVSDSNPPAKMIGWQRRLAEKTGPMWEQRAPRNIAREMDDKALERMDLSKHQRFYRNSQEHLQYMKTRAAQKVKA